MNACEKYWWILDHPEFMTKSPITPQIEIDPHMVCPISNRIEDYTPLNTKLQLWVEMSIPFFDEDSKTWMHSHNPNLDCGGFTWEECIENLFDVVVKEYGFYTEDDHDKKYEEVWGVSLRSSFSSMLNRKFKVSFVSPEVRKRWSIDIMDADTRDIYEHEVKIILLTIQALTEYRKTCSIDEYDEVDENLEKENYALFEAQLSLETGINMVRK